MEALKNLTAKLFALLFKPVITYLFTVQINICRIIIKKFLETIALMFDITRHTSRWYSEIQQYVQLNGNNKKRYNFAFLRIQNENL